MPNGYDRIAPMYDAIAGIASFNQINKSQLAFLSHLSTKSTCLILGGGTGYFLQKLVEINKTIHVTYVEASEKMVVLAKKRIHKNIPDALQRITFIRKRVEDFEFDRYDLIVCNYFLDLFEESQLSGMIRTYNQCLESAGLLYITDFTFPDSGNMLGKLTNIGLKHLYLFFKWTTSLAVKRIPDIHEIVVHTGFEEIQSKCFFKEVLRCSVYEKKLFWILDGRLD